MELDPYKVLEVPKNFTLEQLRSQYKKIALSVHPDKTPGNSDYMFKMVTKCYKNLLEELNRRNADKQFHELKSSFQKHQDNERSYKNVDIDDYREREVPFQGRGTDRQADMAKRFNLDKFNQVFDDNRVKDFTDIGYKEWMDKNEIKDAPTLGKNITKERFNEQFEKYADEIKDKSNKYIIKYKEPEALSMCKKLNFIELGTDIIDDFSGENRSNRDLNYMDYKVAHSTTRLVDPTAFKQRKEYRTVDDYERERSNIKKFSQKELAELEKRKKMEEIKEKKKQEYQKKLDELTSQQFERINKVMLAMNKY